MLMLIDSFKTSDYIKMFKEVCPEAKDSKPGQINSENLPLLKSVIVMRGDKPKFAAKPKWAKPNDKLKTKSKPKPLKRTAVKSKTKT
jgi:hypothetical protein